jgi:hypothetical protein
MRAYEHVNQARDACISTSIIAARQTLHSSTRRSQGPFFRYWLPLASTGGGDRRAAVADRNPNIRIAL